MIIRATTHINIRPYYAIKQEASRCHTSQFAGGPDALWQVCRSG